MPTISLFGWLENIPWWRDLSYPAKGAILRAFKAALSLIVSVFLSLLTAGLLFPAGWEPAFVFVMTTILTSILQGADKFLREWNIAKDNNADPIVLADNANGE